MALPPHLADLDRRLRARFEQAVDDLRRQYESRLRRAHEETLAALQEVRVAAEPGLELEAAELERAPRYAGRSEALETLLATARAFDGAPTQAGVLDALLGGALRFASRAALWIVRESGLTGWSSAGFDGDPVGGRELEWRDVAFDGARLGRGILPLGGSEARSMTDRLGVAPADEAALIPLVLRDRIAAALYVDAAAPAALELAALQLLSVAAAARIELLALGDRSWTPTLYRADERAGDGLSLWSAQAMPAAAAEPPTAPAVAAAAAVVAAAAEAEPVVTAAEPGGAGVWSESGEAPAVAAAPLAEAPAAWTPEAEPAAWSAEPVPAWSEPAPAAETEPAVAEAPAPIEDAWWMPQEGRTAAETAGFEVEPEPTVSEPPAPATPPPAAPPLGQETVRIPAFRPESAPPAPTPLAATDATEYGFAGTQQIRAFPSPPPTLAPTGDAAEDATVLSPRGGPAPALPPAAPVHVPAEKSDMDATDQTGVRTARGTEVAPPPDVRGPGLAFAPGRSARATGDGALHDEAKRLARLLVSEIKLYNEEQVLEGRRNRDLYVRLKEDIDRSRQIYDERVHESVRQGTDYFHQELVRSLAGGDPRALGL